MAFYNLPMTQDILWSSVTRQSVNIQYFADEYWWGFNIMMLMLHFATVVAFLPGMTLSMLLIGYFARSILRATVINF